LAFEWAHLLRKLQQRHPRRYEELRAVNRPKAHPLFPIMPGLVRAWERAADEPGPAGDRPGGRGAP
jgi:hypothetical protein